MEKKIIFYTTHCPKCKVVEMKMQQKGIDYTECSDINEMKTKGLNSAPAIEVDGNIYMFSEAIKYINQMNIGD